MANILNGLNIAFGLSPNGRIYFDDYKRVGSLFFDEWRPDIVGVVVSNIKDFCQTFQQLKKEEKKKIKQILFDFPWLIQLFIRAIFFCRYFFSIFLKMFRKIMNS